MFDPANNLHQQLEALQRQLREMQDAEARRRRDQDYAMQVLGRRGVWPFPVYENVDPSNPVEIDILLPATVKEIRQARLRLRLKQFRSYSGTTESGGGATSGSSSASTTVSAQENVSITTVSYWPDATYNLLTTYEGLHNHGLANGIVLQKADGGTVTWVESGTHRHGSEDHGHNINIPGHSHGMNHTHSVPAHSHGIAHGIYLGPMASNVTVVINGTDRTTELGGPFNADQDLNVQPYLVPGGWTLIQIGSATLGRIHGALFVEQFEGR